VIVALADCRVGSHDINRDGLFGHCVQRPQEIDGFPGLWLHHARSSVQQGDIDSRLFEQSTKTLPCIAFCNPKRRLTVVESFSLHDQHCTEQILARKRRLETSFCCRLTEFSRIGMQHLEDFGIGIRDLADCLVFAAILAYDSGLLLVIGTKIQNCLGLQSHPCPP
jgi:hypothetical protein